MKRIIFLFVACLMTSQVFSQTGFNGLDMNMGNLYRMSDAKTRSISPENFTGEKGKGGMATPDPDAPINTANATHAARDLGQGWKVNPFIRIKPGETFTLAEIDGPGAIQHIWMTPTGNWRFSIIRIYWDDEETPSVEVPVGDFFGMGWGVYAPLVSQAVTVNPGSAFNCYWPMPFRRKCKITMENINDKDEMRLYYQINYTLTDVPDDAAYFHAQFNRTNPNETSDYTIVENIKGIGFKEASHFLRNTGHNNVAILDKHVQNIMLENNLICELPKTMNPKNYVALESLLGSLAKKLGLNQSELDLYLWFLKTGKVLK